MNIEKEEEEIWKPIKGYEEFYLISKDGDIKSVERCIYLKNYSYIRREQDIIQAISADGYKRVKLYNNTKKTKTIGVHRLVALTYLDNPNNYPAINHKDGNKLNNSIDNLEFCTFSHNNTHAYKTGLIKKENYSGEKCYFAKLTEKQVLDIRDEYAKGDIFQTTLGLKYNTTTTNINAIVNRNTWKHV